LPLSAADEAGPPYQKLIGLYPLDCKEAQEIDDEVVA
jgi:hypothetical protein